MAGTQIAPTKSPNKKSLVRHIEEALVARAAEPAPADEPQRPMHTSARDAGARARARARDGEPLDVKILPLRLEADVADKMDEAWRAKGIKNRMEFFRGAIGHYLVHLGARDAGVLFTNAGTMSA